MARNARRLLASRLRELRETAFDVKVTQDQLAEALGEDKPLSSAAISTWENGQTDKRPSESRIVQYALIFSTPHSLHPTPHTPVESKLDNAARTRYENLRDELLELREGAEREAKRERADPAPSDANELWHHPRTEKLFVVVPELPPDQWAPFVRESNVNYVRLARYGDLDAFFEMFTALTRMGYRNLSHRSADEPGIGTARNLVLLGGPAWNGLTRTFLHLLDIPIKQLMEPPGRPDYFTASDGTEVLPTVIEVGDGQSQVIEDVGLFVRTTNPTNPGTDITICSGVYTAGVLGAVRSFTTQHVANENVAAISDRLGQATSFAALFRVKVLEGRVPTPRLTTAIVDCVAIE